MPAILAHMLECARYSSACFRSMVDICFAKKAFIPTSFSSVGSKSATFISAITAGPPTDQRPLTTEAARRRAAGPAPVSTGAHCEQRRRLRQQLNYHKPGSRRAIGSQSLEVSEWTALEVSEWTDRISSSTRIYTGA